MALGMALRKSPHPEREPERSEEEQSKDAASAMQASMLCARLLTLRTYSRARHRASRAAAGVDLIGA
jgi:hypothetical protein